MMNRLRLTFENGENTQKNSIIFNAIQEQKKIAQKKFQDLFVTFNQEKK